MCKIKGEYKFFDVDAITREIMKSAFVPHLNDDSIEKIGDAAGDLATLAMPNKLLEEPARKIVNKGVKFTLGLFNK